MTLFAKKYFFLIITLLTTTASSTYSQRYRGYEDWFFGAHIGATSLWGDITDNENHFLPGGPFQKGYYQDRKVMGGASFGKNISPVYSIRAQVLFGSVTSHTIVEKQVSNSIIQDYSVIVNVDFIDLFKWSTKSNWDFYGFIGLGFSRFRSQLYSATDFIVHPDSIIRYAPYDSSKYARNKYTATLSIPFGLGVNYKIGNNWVINAESSIRYLNTDWLDASGVNPKRSFEGFGFLSLGITYRFNLPRGGSVWSRKSSHSFDAQHDNSGASYRNQRHNGSVTSDPFSNRKNGKSSIKIKSKRKKKTFKTPK